MSTREREADFEVVARASAVFAALLAEPVEPVASFDDDDRAAVREVFDL